LLALGSRSGPAGEWFLSIYGGGVSEQGDAIFTALIWADGRQYLSVYSATPQ
jgi:hypothetical protein